MKLKEFQAICEKFFAEETKLLGIKRQAYAGGDQADVLTNFKQVGAFEGRKPEEVCLTLILKHIQSIQKTVSSGKYISPEFIDSTDGTEGFWQRIADARNYLLLLAALVEERSKEEVEEVLNNLDRSEMPHYRHDFTIVEEKPGGWIYRCKTCYKSAFIPQGQMIEADGSVHPITEFSNKPEGGPYANKKDPEPVQTRFPGRV